MFVVDELSSVVHTAIVKEALFQNTLQTVVTVWGSRILNQSKLYFQMNFFVICKLCLKGNVVPEFEF